MHLKSIDKALRIIDADFSIYDFVENVKRYGKELNSVKTEREFINKQSEASKYINNMNKTWEKQRNKMQEEIYRMQRDYSRAIKDYKDAAEKAQHRIFEVTRKK